MAKAALVQAGGIALEDSAEKFVADLEVLASDWRAERAKAARRDEIDELERKLAEAKSAQAQRLKSVDEQALARVIQAAHLRARNAGHTEQIWVAVNDMDFELRHGMFDPDNARRKIVNAEHERLSRERAAQELTEKRYTVLL